jgi:sugar lactone lactonase YvrE
LRSRRPEFLFALVAAFSLTPGVLGAASVKIWVCDTAAEFSAGEARGVAVASDGTLYASRALVKIDGVSEPVLFAAASGKSGEIFVATGDSGKILRVLPSGKVETEVKLDEQEVTALAMGPDGALYAGASPGGKVYRIQGGKASLYYDTRAQYVWALAFDGPALYVGTGIPGEIHKVTAAGKGARIHATTDAHVRALMTDGQGRVWAGTSGSGLVLRIDKAGHVTTVYDSSKPEVTAIASDRSGRVWVAVSAADTSSGAGGEPISMPAVLPAGKAPKPGSPGEDDDKSRAEVSVSVSTPRLAPARGAARGGYSSEVVLFDATELPRTVWTSADEIVFDLARDPSGNGVLAATGPKGKLYTLAPDSWSLARTFDEKQVTILSGSDVGTNGSSALYRPGTGVDGGEYVSAVKDTGRTSRFGAFRWEGETPAGAKVEFAFRSGESSVADSTWSAWSPWASGSGTLTIAAPEGRYLQWKTRMSPSGDASPRVRRTEAAYRNRNATPVVETFVALDPAEVLARSGSGGSNVFEASTPDEKGIFTGLEDARAEGSPRKLYRKAFRTLQWKASDPDGDVLVYEIEFRPLSGGKWILLRKELRESFYSFDSSSLPDGEYVFRVTASDADANPGDAKTGSRESASVRIDNTPPVIREITRSAGMLEFEASDAASPILDAEYSIDAKKWTHVEPKDGLSDSMKETYVVKVPAEARGGYLLVRVTDASRNVAVAPFLAP